MIGGLEVNQRAGLIADTVADMLRSDGVRDAAVVVSHGFAYDYPLAVRTPEGDGFGADTEAFYHLYKLLMGDAKIQAKYSLVAGGRSASEQLSKLQSLHRSSASYGVHILPKLEPGYAIDKASGLTVVTTSRSIRNIDASKISERAIGDVDRGKKPDHILDAAEFMYTILDELDRDLPSDRSGFAMLALSKYVHNSFDDSDRSPAVVCSQANGQVLSPSNFAIVEAKARTVAITGRPSNPLSTELHGSSSQIEGALPIYVPGLGERVVAAGGLVDGKDDVRVIKQAMQNLYDKVGIVIIDQLTR